MQSKKINKKSSTFHYEDVGKFIVLGIGFPFGNKEESILSSAGISTSFGATAAQKVE